MDRKEIIIILIVFLVIVYLLNRKNEHLDSTSISSEALQNISSVYANTTGIATFNNINVTGNLNAQNFRGIIVMWSGASTAIPAGWVLCDGTNGTPDLKGKFVLGYHSGENTINGVGGNNTVLLSVDNLPPHNHMYRYSIGTNDGDDLNMFNNKSTQIYMSDPNDIRYDSNNVAVADNSSSALFTNTGLLSTWNRQFKNNDGSRLGNSYSFSGYTSHHADSKGIYFDTVRDVDNSSKITTKPVTRNPQSALNITPSYYVLAYIMKL